MLTITVNKQTMTASVVFDGKEQELTIVNPKKESLKPGTRWINLKPLGTPRQWFTVNFEENKEDIFTVEVDESKARVATKAKSRMITLVNFKDFLVDDADKAAFDELFTKVEAERDRQVEEAKASAPVKQTKSRRMTPAEKLAKKQEEMEILQKIVDGELPADYLEQEAKKKREARKAAKVEVENLDDGEDNEA